MNDNLIGFDVVNLVPKRYFHDRIKRPGCFLSFRTKNKFLFEPRKNKQFSAGFQKILHLFWQSITEGLLNLPFLKQRAYSIKRKWARNINRLNLNENKRENDVRLEEGRKESCCYFNAHFILLIGFSDYKILLHRP